MRHLLYPRFPTVVRRNNTGRKTAPSSRWPVDAIPSSSSSTTPSSPTHLESLSSIIQYGQQCSPNCGCVVRFELRTASTPRTTVVTHASYTAKQIILTKDQAKADSKSNHDNYTISPVRTTRNQKLQSRSCNCSTLHKLSHELVQYVNQRERPLHRYQNELEFYSVRSSIGFQQTVLQKHRLPRHHSHCFDLLEEAWTAAVKGFLPQQRKTRQSFPKIPSPLPPTDQPFYLPDLIDPVHAPFQNESYRILTPSSWSSPVWNQASIPPTTTSRNNILDFSSALKMWDIQLLQDEPEPRVEEEVKAVPADWVSFVDEIIIHDQEESPSSGAM